MPTPSELIEVRWFGNDSSFYDGRCAKVSVESVVAVNEKKIVEKLKLKVGDVVKLKYPDDSRIWLAVVVADYPPTPDDAPSRLVRAHSPWIRPQPLTESSPSIGEEEHTGNGSNKGPSHTRSGRISVPPDFVKIFACFLS